MEVTRETIDGLAGKLDTFAATLSDDERAVLGALLAAGVQSASSEVIAFGDKGKGHDLYIESWSFGSASLGRMIASVEISNLKAGSD